MTALTDNATILAAANQIIVALNEISSQISGGSGNEALNRIGDAIEAQTTMLETRSVAETEAANTNFSNLTQAVDSIDTSSIANAISNCCANLQTQLGNIRIAIQNIRLQPPVITGGGGGYYNGDTGGQYSDDPPADNPEPQVNEYVCKAANYIYWWIDYFLSTFAIFYNIKLVSEQQIISFITANVSSVLSVPETGPGAALVWGIAFVATEAAIGAKNVKILAYLDVIRSKFAENKQAIICDLYAAGVGNDPAAAREVYNTWTADLMEDVLSQEVEGFPYPLSELHRATLSYLLTQVISYVSGYYLCNLLFDVDPDVEAADIPDELDCTDCGGCVTFQWAENAEGWEGSTITNDNEVTTEWVEDFLRCEIIKHASTQAFAYWTYTPPSQWIASTGDAITAQLLLVYTCATGAILRVAFTDETTQEHYQETFTPGNRYDFEVIISSDNSGKQIDFVQLEFHSGTNADNCTGVGAWEFCEVCLSAGV